MLDRDLPVFRGIANILRRRTLNVREPRPQRCNNVARLIQAERGLRQVCLLYTSSHPICIQSFKVAQIAGWTNQQT